MKKNIISSIFSAILLFSVSVSAAEWKCQDGKGNIVKDSSQDHFDLIIRQPDKVTWAKEDGKGTFLKFAGGTVFRGVEPKMIFPDGMIIRIRFAANLKDAPKTWLPLITLQEYDKGYTVWIQKNGQLLVCFPGADNWYKMINAGIQNLKDYDLQVIRGQERVQVILNGKVIADYASKGKTKTPAPNVPLFLGGTGSWPFYGNIYYCSITQFKDGSFMKNK